MVFDTPTSQDAFTHKFWNSYLKDYRRYASDQMLILETRSEGKVTVTKGWYAALRHPKMHTHTKFGILTSNYEIYAPDTNILKLGHRSKSQ